MFCYSSSLSSDKKPIHGAVDNVISCTFYDVYFCVVLPVANKRLLITGSVCVVVLPSRELGHWVGGADHARSVFGHEKQGGRQRVPILPVTSH